MSYFLNYWYRLLHCIDWADAVREAAILPLALQLEMADWNVSLSAANEGRSAPIIIHAMHQFLNNGAPHKASGSLLIEIHRPYIPPPPHWGSCSSRLYIFYGQVVTEYPTSIDCRSISDRFTPQLVSFNSNGGYFCRCWFVTETLHSSTSVFCDGNICVVYQRVFAGLFAINQ